MGENTDEHNTVRPSCLFSIQFEIIFFALTICRIPVANKILYLLNPSIGLLLAVFNLAFFLHKIRFQIENFEFRMCRKGIYRRCIVLFECNHVYAFDWHCMGKNHIDQTRLDDKIKCCRG